MAKLHLTQYDRQLVREIGSIIDRLNLNLEQIAAEKDPEYRRVSLKGARLHFIRGEIITQFTLIDDLLTQILAIEMLGGRAAKPWKRKKVRFERVKAVLLDSRMSMRHKLELYRAYRRVPSSVVQIIVSLNTLRNAVAHVFFLEGRKRRAKYRGQDILKPAVFDHFLEDMAALFDFLLWRH